MGQSKDIARKREVINGNPKLRGHLAYLHIDWRIILKYGLKKGYC
jgi:hypothetical protein